MQFPSIRVRSYMKIVYPWENGVPSITMITRTPSNPKQPFTDPPAHVRGGATYRDPATFEYRLGAGVIDGSVAIAVFFLLHRALGLNPVPNPWWLAAVIFLIAMSWGAQRAWLGRTLGDLAWRLKAAQAGLREPLLKPMKHSPQEILAGVFLTTTSVLTCAWSIDLAVFKQPVWARAEALELEAFLPDVGSGQWEVLPFFFSLGAWPRTYAGKPVFYTLPYEKGPPDRFVGHLSARWEDPGTRVTFEGPKTPQAPVSVLPGDRTPREQMPAGPKPFVELPKNSRGHAPSASRGHATTPLGQ
jgi:hypothetical protein